MNNPKVSIIIPVYNGSNFLKEAIDSALAQTYKNIEVIVINDGSNDNGATESIAKSYGKKIKYYKKENGGVATALNFGIEKMTGKYFSWLSHDDLYKPFKVEKQIKFLSNLADKKVILYSDYELIDTKNKLIEQRIQDHDMLERAPIYSLLRGILNGITMLVPKEVFEIHGNFNASLRCTQDYDMWYRIFNYYDFIHIPQILSMTRIHPSQDTTSDPRSVSEGNDLWIKMIRNLPDEDKIKAEGSLLRFNLEMVKFIKYTPYDKAAEYCREQLMASIAKNSVKIDGIDNKKEAYDIYNTLIIENQKVSSAYYIKSLLSGMIKNKNNSVIEVARELLVGNDISSDDEINKTLKNIGCKKDKQRIMFCSGHWLTGGMERVMSILFQQLNPYFDIYLITPSDGRESKISLPKYVTHIKMSNQKFYDNYDCVALAYGLLLDVDVVIGFMNLFDKQLNLYELCKTAGVKTIASNHEIYFYPYKSQYHYDLVKKRLDVFADVSAVLWLTSFSASVYKLANSNGYLIPNPNTYAIQPELGNERKEKIILCVGRFNDYIKRVDRILDCFSLVLKTHPDAKLLLVGKYDRKAPFKPDDNITIDEIIKKQKINEKNIVFIGEVSDVEKYYKQASLLLLASNNEGFGMVINEAASFGVPSVCNKIAGLEDLVIDGHNGYLVEQDDIKAMANKVNDILSDDKLRDNLGKEAKEYVKKFDADKVGDQWRHLIEAVITSNSNKDIKYRADKFLPSFDVDYKKLSKQLFDELNDVFHYQIENRKSGSREDVNGSFIVNEVKYHYDRLAKSIRTKGVKKTFKAVIKKAYRRAKRK